MDVFYTYTHATAAWLGLQACALTVTPKLIIGMLASDYHVTTDIEIYLSRCLGFTLATVSVIALLFTGTIPLSGSVAVPADGTDEDRAPYTIPIITATTFYHFISLVYCYVRYVNQRSGQAGYLLGCLGYGVLAAMGLWCIVFGGGSGRLSKRTGADKRTTGYPFRNEAAYDKKKDKKLFREVRKD